MKLILTSLRATLVLAAVTCGVYPLLITVASQAIFAEKSHGSLILDKDGTVRGSTLIGQNFTSDQYFHPRPSVAGTGYDASNSSGSNLGPISQKLHDAIQERIATYRTTNGLAADEKVPADAVTASASGLDPHISVRNAMMQAERVAKARSLRVEKIKELITKQTNKPEFGILGETGVNVLKLNLALDGL